MSDEADFPSPDDLSVLEFLALGTRGRAPSVLRMERLRDITMDELRAMTVPGEAPAGPLLQKVRQIHHLQARLLSEGRTQTEVAALCGTSINRLSMLQKDPMFQELIEYYRRQGEHAFVEVKEKLGVLGTMATEELIERLDEKPESFSNDVLMRLGTFALDRSIAPGPAAAAGPAQVTMVFAGMSGGPPAFSGPPPNPQALPAPSASPLLSQTPEPPAFGGPLPMLGPAPAPPQTPEPKAPLALEKGPPEAGGT